MKSVFRFLMILAFVIVTTVFVKLYFFKTNNYSINLDIFDQYFSLFQDSVQNKLNKLGGGSFVSNNDVLSFLNFRDDKVKVLIWEFKDSKNLKLENINIETRINPPLLSFEDGIKFNPGGYIQVTSNSKINLKSQCKFIINYNIENGKLLKSGKYSGYYGSINKFIVMNYLNKPEILIDFGKCNKSNLVLFYKRNDSFFIIALSSFSFFDESTLNVLKLE